MNEQMDLLESLKRKDAGISQALGKEGLEEWKRDFYNAVSHLCFTGETFTSEDVLDLVGLPSGTIKSNANNAVGAMMNGLARKGEIRKTGERRPSQRPTSHGAELTVWVGLRASETHDTHPHPDPVPPHAAPRPHICVWAWSPNGYGRICRECGATQ